MSLALRHRAPVPAVAAARVGVLLTGVPLHPTYASLREGLAALGRIEGSDIVLKPRLPRAGSTGCRGSRRSS